MLSMERSAVLQEGYEHVKESLTVRRLALLALLALALAPTSSAAQAPPPAERPSYAIGDRWVRSDGVYELIRVEGDRYVFAASADAQVHLTRDLVIARVEKGLGLFELDPPPALSWPLAVGKSGTSLGTWRWQGNSAGVYTRVLWTVAAYEDVRVPAGAFKAFRIELRLQRQERLSAREARVGLITMWYAPAARQIVRMRGVNPRGEPWGFMSFAVASVDRPAPLGIALEEAGPVEGRRTRVKGVARSGNGIVELTVTVNGTQLARDDLRASPRPAQDFEVEVPLGAGRNLVLVTAVDASGDRRQEARVVMGPPAPVVARPAPSPDAGRLPGTRDAGAPRASGRPEPPSVTSPPAEPPTAPREATAGEPSIALSSPADRARLEQQGAVLAGIVSAGRGLARVVVTVNGEEVVRREEKPPRPAVALNVPLKLRDGANTIVVTAADVDGRLGQEIRSVQLERLLPLRIAVSYPDDKARVMESSSVVAGLVTSGKGVTSTRVLLNGAEVWAQAERVPQKSVAVAVPVALRVGANAIVISAAEAGGGVQQEVRTIILDAPRVAAVPPAPAAPAAPPRQRWAVVVGVGAYESVAIPRLRYAVPDAEAVYQALVGAAGFKKDNVLLLTDRGERKPTLRNIKWALGTFLQRSARRDDTVVIFFAGHGAPEVDPRGVERDGLAKYLIPADADPDDLYSTALPMDELQTIFSRIEAERVVAFLDACYSGAAGGRTFSSKKTRAVAVDDLFLERLTRSKGRAIVTASRPAEVSIELPELGHGIFSYYLVRGLQGAADLNRDGIVSLQELYEFLEQQVTAKSRSVGGNQHPVMKGELEGVLPLATVRTP